MQEEIGLGPAAERFAGEFVAGINRIQYNQGNGINALAGEQLSTVNFPRWASGLEACLMMRLNKPGRPYPCV